MMLASVVINTYNYGRYLAEAVESLLAQAFPSSEVEIVIVDDGSTDETAAVAASFGDAVRYVRQENEGQAAAINAGANLARGRYVLLLDGDDFFLPNKLAKVVERFESDAPNAIAVFNEFEAFDEINGRRTRGPGLLSQPINAPRASVGRLVGPPTSGISIRRDVLARVAIPSEPFRLCADHFLIAVLPLIGAIAVIAEPLHVYRLHGGNLFQSQERRDMLAVHWDQARAIYRYAEQHLSRQLYFAGLEMRRTVLEGAGPVVRLKTLGRAIRYLAHNRVGLRLAIDVVAEIVVRMTLPLDSSSLLRHMVRSVWRLLVMLAPRGVQQGPRAVGMARNRQWRSPRP